MTLKSRAVDIKYQYLDEMFSCNAMNINKKQIFTCSHAIQVRAIVYFIEFRYDYILQMKKDHQSNVNTVHFIEFYWNLLQFSI